ncbi:hypothetical protein JRQ81_010896 [Phrynocephalus forsythii]|uniref:Ig-like domain-containing protein n=1 Tax=Phrynocephalus forsythii TaxID=171643 RepID=A0A9Q0X799_9SAUR|nr:hypothetical protein JRQ81_010896 [Phrynocephalus forsythii]
MEALPLALGLAALLGLSSAVLEVEVAHSSVVVIEGHRATLPVAYTTHSNGEPYVTWHLQRPGSPHPFQILVYMSGTTRVEDLDLKQRLDFLYHMPSHNVSLAINNTKETDSGQYMCTVNVAGESTKIGKNIGLVNLTCQIHGSPHVGGNISLSCRSVVGKPAPKYGWQRASPTSQVFHAPAQDDVKGTLTLTNLTTEMSGAYVCKASSKAGSSNCTITLAVNQPVNAAVVAGAVAGTLIGLGLIVLFPLQMLAYRRRKKEAQEEMANEIKEDAVAPKTLSWAKSPGSDAVSKNGTLSSINTTRDHKLYTSKPASDTASITTATGSTVGFKPPFHHPQSGTLTPTPSLSSQSLPLYFPPLANGVHCHHANLPAHRNTLQRTSRAQPQAPRQQEPTVSQGLTTSTLNRMGAVPVMVPAQSQAGSLVIGFIVAQRAGVCVEVTVPAEPVMQLRGGNVELPCHYKTSVDKNFMLEWRSINGSSSPHFVLAILYFANNVLYKPGSQSERLNLIHDPPTLGDASIQLSNLRTSDAGSYICEVNNPPDFYGTSSGLVQLTVLMPPSTPVCEGTTFAAIGSDIRMTCNSSEGVPAPIYSWTRLDSKTQVPPANMVQNGKTGTLLLTNISLDFSGTYQCVASNEYGQQSCQLSLHVTGLSQAGAIAGAVIGTLLALLLLAAIVVYVLRYRKQKAKKPESIYSGNEIREDATAPGISGASLERRDSTPEDPLLENASSRPGSTSTTKSKLNHFLV